VRPLIPEDLYRFRFITDVQLSPDGRRAAYVVRTADRERNRYRAAVWVVDAAGGEPQKVTAGETDDLLPRWSADGERIAFVSDRGVVPEGKERAPRNLFVVKIGEAERQLTSLDNDVKDLAWSPDGTRLCVVAKRNWPQGQGEPKVRVYERLRYKTDEEGFLDLRRRHLWLVHADTGALEPLTDGDWDDRDPSWSPDGRSIAFVSNRTPDRERNTTSDVWVLDLDDRALRLITASDGPQEHPSFSPDRLTLAYYGHRDPRAAHAINTHLWVRRLGSDGPRDVLAGWDRTVGSVVITDMRGLIQLPPPAWSPDGKRLYYIGSDQGTANIYEAALEGGAPRPVTRGEHQVVTASFDRERQRFAALVATATEPGDVYVGDVTTGELRRLTRVNDELLRQVYVAKPEPIAFAGADGWAIEGWLLKPQDFDATRQHPLVLQIHGGPHTAYGHSFFHEFQVLAGRGYLVLYTNPRGSQSYGERFAHACVGDWGGKDYEDLMAAVDHVLAQGYVDGARLGITGGSYGGFMTNWTIGHTDRFAAAVTARSISNQLSSFGTSDIGWHFWEYELGDADPYADPALYLRFSPLAYARRITTPLLILHAENDFRCPIEEAEQLFAALRYLDKTVRMVRYPKDTHDLTRQGKPSNRVHHMASLVEWFDRYIGAPREARAEAVPAT
jgi:dipeptidyl aminopeptidase/acylaminoacyl peptidase